MKKWTGLLVLLTLACLAFNFFPHHGTAGFTYDGSSSSRPVWNLGWARTWFVLDDLLGMQINGTKPYLVIVGQFVLLVVLSMLLRRPVAANGKALPAEPVLPPSPPSASATGDTTSSHD